MINEKAILIRCSDGFYGKYKLCNQSEVSAFNLYCDIKFKLSTGYVLLLFLASMHTAQYKSYTKHDARSLVVANYTTIL